MEAKYTLAREGGNIWVYDAHGEALAVQDCNLDDIATDGVTAMVDLSPCGDSAEGEYALDWMYFLFSSPDGEVLYRVSFDAEVETRIAHGGDAAGYRAAVRALCEAQGERLEFEWGA